MDTAEIRSLTRQAVRELLIGRHGPQRSSSERRHAHRWPFQGTVEVWLPAPDGSEQYLLASCANMSEQGVGVRCEEPLTPGTIVKLAVHQPEVSFHGRALVCHSSLAGREFYCGLRFLF